MGEWPTSVATHAAFPVRFAGQTPPVACAGIESQLTRVPDGPGGWASVSNLNHMTNAGAPIDGLLARAGGVRGLVYTALPVTVFAVVSPTAGLVPAIVAALSAAAAVLGWKLLRRESTRPAVLGFAGVGVCAAFALVTGQAKNFYLPGIWMYLALAIVFTVSVLIRRPLVGVVWARITGRDDTWRRTPRVRLAFDIVTAAMAVVSWSRFLVQ